MSDTSMSTEYPLNVCQMSAECLWNIRQLYQTLPMSTEYLPNVCRISAKCLSNVCGMSVEYLTTMSDTSYVNEYLPNVCRISDNYVR